MVNEISSGLDTLLQPVAIATVASNCSGSMATACACVWWPGVVDSAWSFWVFERGIFLVEVARIVTWIRQLRNVMGPTLATPLEFTVLTIHGLAEEYVGSSGPFHS